MAGPEISVVIRAFNEERFLPRLLDAIRRQRHVSFETIVVDSGSYDRTPQIARENGAKLIEIDSRDFTFGYSLNVGIGAAHGQLVVIVSAHAEPVGEDWLARLVESLRETDIAMVYGRQFGGERSRFSECRDFGRTFGAERKVLMPPEFFANNANSAIRRDLWEQHAFDEFLPGLEDIEWARYWMQQGYRVVYEPKAAIYHIHQESWSQVQRRYYRETVAARHMGLKRRSGIGKELLGELLCLVSDLAGSRNSASPDADPAEIIRFRMHKSLGIVGGLLDGKKSTFDKERDRILFNRKYRAVVVRGPRHASLQEVEFPRERPDDVLIEIAYEGVCGTDLEILKGTLGYFKSGLSAYPIVPGHEFSGWVSKVGANVMGLSVGDRVVVECIQSCGTCAQCRNSNWIACARRKEVGVMRQDGGYAQYVLAPANFVHVIPDGLDLRRAAMCEPLAVVIKGVHRLGRVVGDRCCRCAVVGAGPIGHLCARILYAKGWEVVAFDRDPKRLAYFEGSPIETAWDLRELDQFDPIIEATGSPDVLHTIIGASRAGCTLLCLGLPYARRQFSFEDIVAYDRTVVGSVGSGAADYDEALRQLPALPVDAFLDLEFPLDQFSKAWEAFEMHKALKIFLRVAGE